MLGAQGSELANLIAQLKNPEAIQDQLEDLKKRQDAAGKAEAEAKDAREKAETAMKECDAATKRADAALSRLENARTKREQRLNDLEESLAEREAAVKAAEDAVAVKLSEADGREKDTKRAATSIQARITRHKEKESKLAQREAVIGAFMREVAHLKTALED